MEQRRDLIVCFWSRQIKLRKKLIVNKFDPQFMHHSDLFLHISQNFAVYNFICKLFPQYIAAFAYCQNIARFKTKGKRYILQSSKLDFKIYWFEKFKIRIFI